MAKWLLKQTPEQPVRVVDSDEMTHESPLSRDIGKPFVRFPKVGCGGEPTYYNEHENVRPVTAGTAIALDVIDNAIRAMEATLEDLKKDRREMLEQAYNTQKDRVFFYQDNTWKVEPHV